MMMLFSFGHIPATVTHTNIDCQLRQCQWRILLVSTHNVWEKDRLLKFTPKSVIDARSRHRTMIPEEEYENGHILTSKSCKN